MSTNPKTMRRKKILETALVIFAEKGFQDTTIAEVSKAAEVSETTIYEYFKTKEDLLFAIPEEITAAAVSEWEKILPYLKGTESKLRALVRVYMNLYQNNPHYSALIMLQLKSNKNFLKTRAYTVVRNIAHRLLEFIQEGINEGIFRKDTDPHLVRSMILGTIEHLCIRWHLLGKPSNIVAYVDPLVDMIINGIKIPPQINSCFPCFELIGKIKSDV